MITIECNNCHVRTLRKICPCVCMQGQNCACLCADSVRHAYVKVCSCTDSVMRACAQNLARIDAKIYCVSQSLDHFKDSYVSFMVRIKTDKCEDNNENSGSSGFVRIYKRKLCCTILSVFSKTTRLY